MRGVCAITGGFLEDDRGDMVRTNRPFDTASILHDEGTWKLKSTEKSNARWVSGQGWLSVIEHDCPDVEGAPYWMLIEYASAETVCMYCKALMPDSIVGLFKMMNWEQMK